MGEDHLRIRVQNHAYFVALCGLACSPSRPTPPARVPTQAQWARGVDGGVWVDCHKLAGTQPKYECSIFDPKTGALQARGNFAPNFDPRFIDVTVRSYDGAGVLRVSDTTSLRATDTVDFPVGSGHGKKAVFRYGQQLGEEISY
jgi:hypothetical protein